MKEQTWDEMVTNLARLSGTTEAIAAGVLADLRPPGTDRERMISMFAERNNTTEAEAARLLADVPETKPEPDPGGDASAERIRELAKQAGVSEASARTFLAHLREQTAVKSPGLARLLRQRGGGR